MNSDNTQPCSVRACTGTATHEEVASSAHWTVVISYCDEHYRSLELGTPLGPVGIDPSRLQVQPVGVSEPQTGGITPAISPH
jgi:hypothetical protein